MQKPLRTIWRLVLALVVLAAAPGQVLAQTAGGDEPAGDQVVMEIVDEDALLLISRVDGRDVVRVLGRSMVRHRQRVVWSNQLEYDQAMARAVMTGDVELADAGDDPMQLTADYAELDLDNETAFARGNVRFTQDEVRGSAQALHYGRFRLLQAVIQDQLAARRAVAAAQSILEEFQPDDNVLVLIGAVHLHDGDREFSTDFVVYNTRSEALLSVGRSAARLPGPEE